MTAARIAKMPYRDSLHAMMQTRRYKMSLWIIGTTIVAWCAINAALIVVGISSGTIRQPDTMTRAGFLIASLAYWLSLPLAIGVLAMVIIHVVIPHVITPRRYEGDNANAREGR